MDKFTEMGPEDNYHEKPRLGSKWVVKRSFPDGAGVVKGDVVEVNGYDFDGDVLYIYGEDEWCVVLNNWHKNFSPYEEEVTPKNIEEPDNVNNPSHYGQGNIEAIEYIKDFLTKEEYIGYLRGNIAKYLHRWPYKDGLEDLEKAKVYLGWLTEEVSE